MTNLLAGDSRGASASVGAPFHYDVASKLQRAQKGCATLLVPDGLMVSSTSAIYPENPSPGSPRAGAYFMVGFGRRPFCFGQTRLPLRPWVDAPILTKLAHSLWLVYIAEMPWDIRS